MNEKTTTRVLVLTDGSVFTVELTPLGSDKIKSHLGLSSTDKLTDDMLKEFFAASLAGV